MKKVRKARRAVRRVRNLVILVIVIIAAVAALFGVTGTDEADTASVTAEETASDVSVATFVKKVDGDTAWFKTSEYGEIKVRFLGIDTPETVKAGTEVQEWGPEASEYTTERLEAANEILLEWDPGSDLYDKYDRYLAWVWVDGSLLQEELVEQGLAEVAYIYGDYLYTDRLYAAQNKAQAAGVGIWSE